MFRKLGRFIRRYRYHLGVLFLALGIWYWNCLPDELFADPTSTVVLDREGNLLGARIATDGQWRFPHNPEVPEKFRHCIIQFEDRDFEDHIGFSFKAFGRALWQNVNAGHVVSGGSTITMQVMRMSRKGQSRNMVQKVIELIQATRLEFRHSKAEILALYASNAPFGGNVVGLDAAAWRYFGRSADQLSWSESATLAVLPNAPSLIYPGKNQEKLLAKRNRLLTRLGEVGLIDSIGLHLAMSEPLPQKPHPLPRVAPHLVDRMHLEGGAGEVSVSTIDHRLQQQVSKTLQLHQERLKINEIHNAAALVIDVHSSEVLAYVGNLNSEDPDVGSAVDVIRAPRSTGSILKPFLYAGMLEGGSITPDMLVPDIPTNMGGYSPKNFAQSYDGAVPAGRALARSLNVPAVCMLRDFGVERFHLQLKRQGMSTLTNGPDHYGLSLILGGAEATLWDLGGMYANMARTLNQFPNYEPGINDAPTLLVREESGRRKKEEPILGAGAVWHTLEAMLEVTRPETDINWRAFDSSRKIAWKTGTSFGFRDAWAIGVTPNHVVAIWVGNADGEGRPGLVGLYAAAPILFDVFDHLPHDGWFETPHDDLETVDICRRSGHRASTVCRDVEKRAIPVAALPTEACPYHRLVHLDPGGTHRVDSDCELVSNMKHESWFVLPPVMEWYYKFNNPKYRPLPPYRSDCRQGKTERTMAVIYPKRPSRIYVPVQLDGTHSKTVFEVTHRKRSAIIYWHLDDEYLGTTQDIHQMELHPEIGKHRLTLVDESGNRLSQSFEVIGKEES